VSDATFAHNPGENSWIKTSTINSLLDANTSVTLQANNDIIIAGDIRKETAGTATVTLEAGRSVVSVYMGIKSNMNDIIITAGSDDALSAHTEAGDKNIVLTVKNASKLESSQSGVGSQPGDMILTAPNRVIIDGPWGTNVFAGGSGRTTIDAGEIIHIGTGGFYTNLELIGTNTTALINAGALNFNNLAANLENLYLDNNTSLTIGTIGGTSGITATGTVNLGSRSNNQTFSQTAPITADKLILKGQSGKNTTFNLTHPENDINVLATTDGNNSLKKLNFVNATGFAIGSGTYLNHSGTPQSVAGVSVAETIDITTISGNLTLSEDVTSEDATIDAIKLNSGQSEEPGTTTGGNIIVDGGGVTPGVGGTAILYTGDRDNSAALEALAGYVSSYYYSDETTTLSPEPGAGLYVAYREPFATYTVSYDGNNATGGSAPDPQTKIHGVELTLLENTGNLERDGHIFAGWNTEANGSGTDYAEGATYNIDDDVTLYAKWTAIQEPTVTTTEASDLTPTAVTVGGEVTDDGGDSSTERGVVYSTKNSNHNLDKPEPKREKCNFA